MHNMALTDTHLLSEESHSPSNIASVVSKLSELERNTTATTSEVIKRVSCLGSKSVLERLEEMEKAMEFLQEQLKENAGCINELGYSFPLQNANQGGSSEDDFDAANPAFLIDHGNGLLPFIQKCLRNEAKYFSVIRWTNEQENEFKIVDPEKFAMMWGMEKRKEGMTKRKLTRSLAYLVNSKKRLTRSTTRTFVYQIVPASVEDKRFEDTSSCESNISSPPPPTQNFEQPSQFFSGCSQLQFSSEGPSSKPKQRIPLEALKKMIRKNPQHLKLLIDLQNKKYAQQKQQQQQLYQQPQALSSQIFGKNDHPPTFMLSGSKRSFDNSQRSVDNIYDQFSNNKMTKLEPQQSPTNTFMPSTFTDMNNNNAAANKTSWDMFMETQSDFSSAQCSPESIIAECNNSNYYSHSPFSDTSSVYNLSSDNNSTPYAGQINCLQQQQPENQVTTNFINPVQQTLMVDEPGNLAFINPTFCTTEPTFTTTDYSAYLSF